MYIATGCEQQQPVADGRGQAGCATEPSTEFVVLDATGAKAPKCAQHGTWASSTDGGGIGGSLAHCMAQECCRRAQSAAAAGVSRPAAAECAGHREGAATGGRSGARSRAFGRPCLGRCPRPDDCCRRRQARRDAGRSAGAGTEGAATGVHPECKVLLMASAACSRRIASRSAAQHAAAAAGVSHNAAEAPSSCPSSRQSSRCGMVRTFGRRRFEPKSEE